MDNRQADKSFYGSGSLAFKILMWGCLAAVFILSFVWLGVRNIPSVRLDSSITTDVIAAGGTKTHYDSNNFPLPKRGDRLIFTVTMPEEAKQVSDPVLCFSNYNSVITVRNGDRVLYQHGQAKQQQSYTTGHTVVRVPVDGKTGSTLLVEFLQQEDNTLSSFSSVFLMPAEYSWLYPVYSVRKQVSLALFMVFALFSALVLIFSAAFSIGKQEMMQGFMLSMFCFSMTGWALGFSGTLFAVTNDDAFAPYAEYVATYLMAIFFCGYMLQSAASYGWRKKVTSALEIFFITIFAIASLIQIFSPDHNGYLVMLTFDQSMLGICGIFFLVLVFRDKTSAGKVFRSGMAATLCLAVLEVVFAIIGRAKPVDNGIEQQFAMESLTPVVVLVFQATLLADYLSRVYRAYRRRKEYERMEMVAYTDALTGLDSRACFEDRELPKLEQAGSYAIAFIDADGLKEMNDCYGHSEGDRLLRYVSEAIRKGCDSTDCHGFRYGGDEFLIVGKNREIVETALSAMEKELSCTGSARPISVSSGIAEYHGDSPLSVSDVIREADSLMYRRKKEKRACRAKSSMGPAGGSRGEKKKSHAY